MPTPPLWLRRALRPLIPDRVMARLRLREHSRQVRTNTDIVLTDTRSARRWLASTPDTYRVRGADSFVGAPPADLAVYAAWPLTAEQRQRLLAPLADPTITVSIAGEVDPPGLVGRRRNEPEVAPLAIAASPQIIAEVGGVPDGDDPLPGLLGRLRDAGHHLALQPAAPAGRSHVRTDPVTAPSAVVLGLVPMHDVGGGSRGTQIALELLEHGWHVTYVALYGTAESHDLGLRFVHPRLEQYRANEADLASVAARVRSPHRLVILEAPVGELVAAADTLRGHGYALAYDLIDDWSAPSLGGDWYDPDRERDIAGRADALLASAVPLADHLAEVTGRGVTLVPNAVNARVFGRAPGPVPDDLPPGGGAVIGYHGSLYGDWFDWDALRAVATDRPGDRVVVIGDIPDALPPLPDNVHFLGLKPHGELPDYLACFDVAIIPFAVTPVTHAVSPLKAYEYLACGVPVAAPPLIALEGLGLHLDTDLPAAVRAALAGPRPDVAAALEEHGWRERVTRILAATELSHAGGSGEPARVLRRPATHFARGERRLP